MSDGISTSQAGGLINRAAHKLSLYSMAQGWAATLRNSLLLKPFFVVSILSGRWQNSSLSWLGTSLQKISLALTVILFLLTGMHQFVEDKYKLALVVLTALAFWIVGRLLHGRERRPIDAYDALVLAYFGANIVSAFASHYFLPSLRGLSKVAVFIASYFLFTANLNGSLKRKLIVAGTAIATGAALSCYGLYQYKIGVAPLATWEDPSVESSGTRIFATLDNPNLLAGLLVPLVPLALSIAVACLEKKRYLAGSGLLLIAVLIGLATLLTQSRGGMLGLIASVVVILYIWMVNFWRSKPKKRMILAGILLVLIIGFVFAANSIPFVSQRFESIAAGWQHSSNAYRLNVYASSLKMFKDSWWLGTGPGNETFRLAYGLYMVSSYDALGTYSVPLEVAVETGIGGVFVFLLLIASALARAHLKFWSDAPPEIDSKGTGVEKDPLGRWLAGGCAGALVGLMVHGLGDTVFYRPQVHFLFWLIIAMTVTEDTRREPESSINTP